MAAYNGIGRHCPVHCDPFYKQLWRSESLVGTTNAFFYLPVFFKYHQISTELIIHFNDPGSCPAVPGLYRKAPECIHTKTGGAGTGTHVLLYYSYIYSTSVGCDRCGSLRPSLA